MSGTCIPRDQSEPASNSQKGTKSRPRQALRLAFDNKEHRMKKVLYPIILLAGMARGPLAMLMAQAADAQHHLVLSDAVLPTTSMDPLLDARIFNPEFY